MSRFGSIQKLSSFAKMVPHLVRLSIGEKIWKRPKIVLFWWWWRRRRRRLEINEAATLKVRELPAGPDRKGICRREK